MYSKIKYLAMKYIVYNKVYLVKMKVWTLYYYTELKVLNLTNSFTPEIDKVRMLITH